MRSLVLMLLLLAGCQPYVQVQMDLTRQARQGLQLASQAQARSRDAIQQLHALQRDRLDDAFDADVRARAALDVSWVIDHRKAYALGLDALAQERYASQAAHDTALRNLAATDAALEQLSWLQSIQMKWLRIHRQNQGGAAMNRSTLQQQVEQAVGTVWADFERDHPALAKALTRHTLTDWAIAELTDDPEYRRAMAESSAMVHGADAAYAIVHNLVLGILQRWLA